MSAGTTLYLLLEQNTEVSTRDVRLSDVAKMACTDEHALNRLKTIKLFRIPSGKKFRKTMTVVDIIEKVQALYPNMEVNNLGETDFIVTYVGFCENRTDQCGYLFRFRFFHHGVQQRYQRDGAVCPGL